MKNNIVRAFVVALVLTGAAASTRHASASATTPAIGKLSAGPIPSCPPDDPNACGISE